MIRHYFFIVSFLVSAVANAQLFQQEPSKLDTIFYPFYNGVQMIEIDHTGFYWRRISYLEVTQPKGLPHTMTEPAPRPNAYIFRNTEGEIVKSFNTWTDSKTLTKLFKNVPIHKKSTNILLESITHAYRLSRSLEMYYGGSSSQLSGFYIVYNNPPVMDVNYLVISNQPENKPSFLGLIDSLGNVQIPMVYTSIIPIKKNILAQKNSQWGIIDVFEKQLVSLKYDEAKWVNDEVVIFLNKKRFQLVYEIHTSRTYPLNNYDKIKIDGLSYSEIIQFEKDNKIGFINNQYQEIIPPQYEIVDFYSNQRLGPFRVFRNGKWGYINRFAEEVIPCKYEHAELFSQKEIALVQLNKKQFCINTLGVKQDSCTLRPKWESKNYGIVKQNGRYGRTNMAGIVITPVIYQMIRSEPKESFIRIYKNDKQGIIRDTTFIIPCEYDKINAFYKELGLAITIKNGKYGAIDTAFKVIIPNTYELLKIDPSHHLIFVKNGKYGMMDASQNIIIQPEYDNLYGFNQIHYSTGANELSMVKKGGLYGYINLKGKVVIPIKYEWLYYQVYNDLVSFREKGKLGYLNTRGKVVIPAKFDNGYEFRYKITAVQKNEKWALINTKGKLLTRFVYDYLKVGNFKNSNGFVEGMKSGELVWLNEDGEELE